MKVLLGICKPIMMQTPFCDNLLAVMDAGTFKEDQESPLRLHLNFGFRLLVCCYSFACCVFIFQFL